MTLKDVTVEIEEDLLKLAKLKGIDIDKVCQDALDILISLPDDPETLSMRITEIDKNIERLRLEKAVIHTKLKNK